MMNNEEQKQDKIITIQMYESAYKKLQYLGLYDERDYDEVRSRNVGNSNYAEHFIQSWSIWLDYPELTSFDHDIIKRVLRTKKGENRFEKYEKIIHICQERIRQIQYELEAERELDKQNEENPVTVSARQKK